MDAGLEEPAELIVELTVVDPAFIMRPTYSSKLICPSPDVAVRERRSSSTLARLAGSSWTPGLNNSLSRS